MYKQIIVMRADLGMGRGKQVAQGGHAVLLAYQKATASKTSASKAQAWEQSGMLKVTLKVGSESELFEYLEKAKAAGIPCGEVVRDAGHTQLEPGTVTCFATVPWEEEELDAIFGKLKLL